MGSRLLRFRASVPRLVGVVLLGAVILALVWQGLLLLVATIFPEQVIATFGTIEVGQQVAAVCLRRESVVRAPRGGSCQPTQPSGERVARAAVLAEFGQSGRTTYKLRAEHSGLVAHTTDGLENSLPLGSALAEPMRFFDAARKSRSRRIGRGTVRQGDPVARIVDDREQHLLCRIQNAPALDVGRTVWVRVQDALIPLTVVGSTSQKGTDWLLLRTERFPPAWLDHRLLDFFLIWGRHTGTVLPNRYIREREGQPGVTSLIRGHAEFVPVEVLGRDRHQAVVRGLREGDIVVAR